MQGVPKKKKMQYYSNGHIYSGVQNSKKPIKALKQLLSWCLIAYPQSFFKGKQFVACVIPPLTFKTSIGIPLVVYK